MIDINIVLEPPPHPRTDPRQRFLQKILGKFWVRRIFTSFNMLSLVLPKKQCNLKHFPNLPDDCFLCPTSQSLKGFQGAQLGNWCFNPSVSLHSRCPCWEMQRIFLGWHHQGDSIIPLYHLLHNHEPLHLYSLPSLLERRLPNVTQVCLQVHPADLPAQS